MNRCVGIKAQKSARSLIGIPIPVFSIKMQIALMIYFVLQNGCEMDIIGYRMDVKCYES